MGNICRSPTAHGVMRHKALHSNLNVSLEVDSAGTHNYHPGSPPDARSQAHARRRGYAFSDLRARQIRDQDFLHYDQILVMDHDNLSSVQAMCPVGMAHKIQPLTQWCSRHSDPYVPDPYYGGEAGFEHVLDLIEDACDGLLRALGAGDTSEKARAESAKPRYPVTLTSSVLRELLPQRGALYACQSLQIQGPLDFTGTALWEAGHPAFDGHFPEQPLVPGVLLIETATQLAGAGLAYLQANSNRGVLAKVRQARFIHPVSPGQTVDFVLHCQTNTGGVRIHASLAVNAQPVAQIETLLVYRATSINVI